MFTGITSHVWKPSLLSISRFCLYFFSILIFFPFILQCMVEGLKKLSSFCEPQPLCASTRTGEHWFLMVWHLKRDRRQLLGSGGGFHVHWISQCHDFKCCSQESSIEALHFRYRPHFPTHVELYMVPWVIYHDTFLFCINMCDIFGFSTSCKVILL